MIKPRQPRLPKRIPKIVSQKVTRRLYTAEVSKHPTKDWQHIRIRSKEDPSREIQGEIRGKEATLSLIYVPPTEIGIGFGSKLLNHMMAEFGRRKVKVVRCLYFADSAGFFKKYGFRELKRKGEIVEMEITMEEWKRGHGKGKR